MYAPEFQASPRVYKLLEEISRIREQLRISLVKVPWVPSLVRDAMARAAWGSTAIEGCTLSLEAVRGIMEGKDAAGYPHRYVRMARNYLDALAARSGRSPGPRPVGQFRWGRIAGCFHIGDIALAFCRDTPLPRRQRPRGESSGDLAALPDGVRHPPYLRPGRGPPGEPRALRQGAAEGAGGEGGHGRLDRVHRRGDPGDSGAGVEGRPGDQAVRQGAGLPDAKAGETAQSLAGEGTAGHPRDFARPPRHPSRRPLRHEVPSQEASHQDPWGPQNHQISLGLAAPPPLGSSFPGLTRE